MTCRVVFYAPVEDKHPSSVSQFPCFKKNRSSPSSCHRLSYWSPPFAWRLWLWLMPRLQDGWFSGATSRKAPSVSGRPAAEELGDGWLHYPGFLLGGRTRSRNYKRLEPKQFNTFNQKIMNRQRFKYLMNRVSHFQTVRKCCGWGRGRIGLLVQTETSQQPFAGLRWHFSTNIRDPLMVNPPTFPWAPPWGSEWHMHLPPLPHGKRWRIIQIFRLNRIWSHKYIIY